MAAASKSADTSNYFAVQKNGVSPFQNLCCYLGGSAIQTVGDNPVTAYRQYVQQFAKNAAGETVPPAIASKEAKAVFIANPVAASLSGLWPRLIGVLFKRIPKFGILLGYTTITGNTIYINTSAPVFCFVQSKQIIVYGTELIIEQT